MGSKFFPFGVDPFSEGTQNSFVRVACPESVSIPLSGLIQQTTNILIFPLKRDLIFYAKYRHWRQFAWNVKTCFLQKNNEKYFSMLSAKKFYQELRLAPFIGKSINWLINSIKMIIITDLIIDHLISVFVTLPYLPLVFRHLNSLPYII